MKIFDKTLIIAFVHAKVGLEPKWYKSAFQDLLNGFFSIVQQTHFNHEEQLKIINAIGKIINFEQQIVLEAYEKRHQESLKKMTSQNLQHLVDESCTQVLATDSSFEKIVGLMNTIKFLNNELFIGVLDINGNLNSIQKNSERIHNATKNLTAM